TPPPPTPTPRTPPSVSLFAVPCEVSGDVSELQVIGDLFDLHVLIDGEPVDVDADGFVTVEPGPHHWEVRTDIDEELVAEGDVTVPSCQAAPTPTPTP